MLGLKLRGERIGFMERLNAQKALETLRKQEIFKQMVERQLASLPFSEIIVLDDHYWDKLSVEFGTQTSPSFKSKILENLKTTSNKIGFNSILSVASPHKLNYDAAKDHKCDSEKYLQIASKPPEKQFSLTSIEHEIPIGVLSSSPEKILSVVTYSIGHPDNLASHSVEEMIENHIKLHLPEVEAWLVLHQSVPGAFLLVSPTRDQYHPSFEHTHFALKLANIPPLKISNGVEIRVNAIQNYVNASINTLHIQAAVNTAVLRPLTSNQLWNCANESEHKKIIDFVNREIEQNFRLFSLIAYPNYKIAIMEHNLFGWFGARETKFKNIDSAKAAKSQEISAKFDLTIHKSQKVLMDTAVKIYDGLHPAGFEALGNIAINKSPITSQILFDWLSDCIQNRNLPDSKNVLKSKLSIFLDLFGLPSLDFFMQESESKNENEQKVLVYLVNIINTVFLKTPSLYFLNYYNSVIQPVEFFLEKKSKF